MSTEPQRGVRLVDAMALIALVAVSLVMVKSYLRCFTTLYQLVSTEPSNGTVMGFREWLYACVPSLILVSAALWPFRFTRPVRRFRRTARLSGLTVSYAAWVALAFALVRSIFDLRTDISKMYYGSVGLLSLGDIFVSRVVTMKDFMGPAIAVTWLFLWLGGAWRTEPDWLDRLGRRLGYFWIAFGFAFWVDSLVRP